MKSNITTQRCGLIINEACPYFAASPDRKVIDSSLTNQFGLVEIKCPKQETKINNLPYLIVRGDLIRLKRNHKYYYQMIMQMALTGCEWCDFFVYKMDECFYEKIYFNENVWRMMQIKLEWFFFNYYL